MRRWRGTLQWGLAVGSACLLAMSVPAAEFDAANGGAGSSRVRSHAGADRRDWALGDFSSVRLVPREAGSAPNEQPHRVDAEALRQLLSPLRIPTSEGSQSLFATDELAELIGPLAQAFANAGPDDDVLVLSSSRRGGVLTPPLAVTARVFVQGGSLHFIAHDSRYEFYNHYRGSGRPPEFTFGSRTRVGKAKVLAGLGASSREDWVVLPLDAIAGVAGKAPTPATRPSVMPDAAGSNPPAAIRAPASSPSAVGNSRARDAAFSDEIEQRLVTLKRLRDKGLISEEEYRQKRKEVLQLL
jgi:Short C-terminal domain